jgi:hypothetical protein
MKGIWFFQQTELSAEMLPPQNAVENDEAGVYAVEINKEPICLLCLHIGSCGVIIQL